MSDKNSTTSPPGFSSWRSYLLFRNEVTRSARYVRSPETIAFLETVAKGLQSRAYTFNKGRQFYRAQVAHNERSPGGLDHCMPSPALPERMMPLVDRATEGRVNPKGIPCLYVASDAHTAIAETRPWIGSLVSVAVLVASRDLRVVNCTHIGNMIYLIDDPPPSEIDECVWGDIARAFREPVTRNDDLAEYAPTQIIAEVFKAQGFDGVAYRSAFGTDRYNVAIFDVGAAELAMCSLYEIKDIEFKHQETTNPYYVQSGENGSKELISNEIVDIAPVGGLVRRE